MADQDQVFAKCAWRLMPLIIALYVFNYMDRTNVGFAALTMNKDLGFSPSVYGLGAGILFVTFALFQVPANIILDRVGARRWMFCILAVWGAISAANALIRGPASFYLLRLLLGAAEAGFVPGILLYLSYWFPQSFISRFTAMFMAASVFSLAIGGPLASVILGLDGILGLHGWRWLFMLEGAPAFVLAFVVLRFLPDRPAQAAWLTSDEKKAVEACFIREDGVKEQKLLPALRDPRVFVLGAANFGLLAAATGNALWLPQVVQAMGFSTAATGFVTAVPYLCGVLAMILWGTSSDRRKERVWHIALPALLATAGFSIAAATQDYRTALVALTIAEIGVASALGPIFSFPSSFLRGRAAAGGIAVFNMIGSFGSFSGPYLIGVLRLETDGYATGMAMMAGATALTALIVLGLGRAMAPRVAVAAATRTDA